MASSTAPGYGGELNGGELNGLSGDTARRRSTTASSRRARRERAVCMVCGMYVMEEEVYTRSLPLTSCQEDRLGLDYTVLCHG